MTMVKDFCVVCADDREFRREQQQINYDVRGEKVALDVPVKVCTKCSATETENLDLAAMAFAEYRKKKCLLTPEQIKELRERYQLSQKSLATLLGMSEATINRYEGGGLQDLAHDAALRACQSPEFVRDLILRNGGKLSTWQRQRVEESLDSQIQARRGIVLSGNCWGMSVECSSQTGYREFDYQRYAAVVVWLCRHISMVTATSLNKLLFYVDFLHFKSEAVSITGAAYRRLQHGPVPAAYGDLQQTMEMQDFISVAEVTYKNGNTGIQIQAGAKADELDIVFTPRELKILNTVAAKFRNYTPGKIRDYSHEETAWRNTEEKAIISYEMAADLSLATSE